MFFFLQIYPLTFAQIKHVVMIGWNQADFRIVNIFIAAFLPLYVWYVLYVWSDRGLQQRDNDFHAQLRYFANDDDRLGSGQRLRTKN